MLAVYFCAVFILSKSKNIIAILHTNETKTNVMLLRLHLHKDYQLGKAASGIKYHVWKVCL